MTLRLTAAALAALACVACRPVVPCTSTPVGEGVEREVCIPGGPFHRGHAPLPLATCKPTFPNTIPGGELCSQPANNWSPEGEITLSPFFIDMFEVSWSRYERCVSAGACPSEPLDSMRRLSPGLVDRGFFTEPGHPNRPVENVPFAGAEQLCAFEGKRLPTEAEWERAARGPDGRDFPWGNDPPSVELIDATHQSWDCASLHSQCPSPSAPACLFDDCVAEVGTHPLDASKEGVMDLFGSLSEWVSDWYAPDAYATGAAVDPTGPSTGESHVLRGDARCFLGHANCGGEPYEGDYTRQSEVWFRSIPARDPTAGFRCVRGGP